MYNEWDEIEDNFYDFDDFDESLEDIDFSEAAGKRKDFKKSFSSVNKNIEKKAINKNIEKKQPLRVAQNRPVVRKPLRRVESRRPIEKQVVRPASQKEMTGKVVSPKKKKMFLKILTSVAFINK